MATAPALAEDWPLTDRILGGMTVASLATDWGQTRYIAQHPSIFQENNPILGSHPSTMKANLYFSGAIVGTTLLANSMESSNRKLFLGSVLVFELAVIAKNRSIGIHVDF